MIVLFISSGNRGISPIVLAQGKSLQKAGIDVTFFGLKGRGVFGYLGNIAEIRRIIRTLNPDIVHAHYSLCGIVASLATRKPVVCSLMGSDVKGSRFLTMIISLFVKRVWVATIVKSNDMKQSIGINYVHVIPNGVDIDVFNPKGRIVSREMLGWDQDRLIVLFAANPARQEKNHLLAKQAIGFLNRDDVELKVVFAINHEEMPIFLNAANVLLLTSLWEGSPNVIKEAMACNLPIVSTDVGDVAWLLEGLEGCYVTTHDPDDVASKLIQALEFNRDTNGANKLIDLGLTSDRVARKIETIYQGIVDQESKGDKS